MGLVADKCRERSLAWDDLPKEKREALFLQVFRELEADPAVMEQRLISQGEAAQALILGLQARRNELTTPDRQATLDFVIGRIREKYT